MFKDFFLFKGLSAEEKAKIIAFFPQPLSFKKGDVIYSADKFKNALGLIVEGKASAVANNADGFYKKSFTKNSVFGAAAVFGKEENYVSIIIAETKTEVLFIDEKNLKQIFTEYPQTAMNYIDFLSDKIRFLNKKLNMISCTSAEDTVYKYLISNMNSENYVNIPVSKTTLAKMLGLGRATLYRSFDALENSGKIKRENNIIKVI